MHIALIDFHFYEYTIPLANALASRVQVSLLVPPNFKTMAGTLSPKVNLVYFERPRARSLANLKMISRIRDIIVRLNPDIVHLVAVNPWFNLGLATWCPSRLVTTIHDPVMHSGDRSQKKIPQFVRDIPIRRSQHLIVYGQAIKQVLLKRHAIPPERITVIPLGELSIYQHWVQDTWPEQEGTILFFGRIWPYKGLDYLIMAEPAISRACPDARFVIAGMGEDMDRYRAMMAHPERFQILNEFIRHEDVPRLFQQASLVVLPYTEASQSGVIPLAYAFAKPVVATSVGGIPELVEHGETGLLVPPRDSDALAQAVIALLQNRDTRRRMGQRALDKTRGELSWSAIAEKMMQVYTRVST